MVRTNPYTLAAVNTSVRIDNGVAVSDSDGLRGTVPEACGATGAFFYIESNRMFVCIHALEHYPHRNFSAFSELGIDLHIVRMLFHIRKTHTCAEAK